MKSKKFKLIINILAWVIVGLAVGLAVVNVVMKASNKVFFLGNSANVFIITDSMEPTIPVRTYILIEKVDPKDLKEDDIITFYSSDPTIYGNLNTHRIVGVATRSDGKLVFTTQGDNNPIADIYTVTEDAVVGRYVKSLPLMTVFGRFFMSVPGLIVILLMILAMGCSMFLPNMLKKAEDESKKTSAEQKQKLIDEMVKAEVERLKRADEAEKASSDNDKNNDDTAN